MHESKLQNVYINKTHSEWLRSHGKSASAEVRQAIQAYLKQREQERQPGSKVKPPKGYKIVRPPNEKGRIRHSFRIYDYQINYLKEHDRNVSASIRTALESYIEWRKAGYGAQVLTTVERKFRRMSNARRKTCVDLSPDHMSRLQDPNINGSELIRRAVNLYKAQLRDDVYTAAKQAAPTDKGGGVRYEVRLDPAVYKWLFYSESSISGAVRRALDAYFIWEYLQS